MKVQCKIHLITQNIGEKPVERMQGNSVNMVGRSQIFNAWRRNIFLKFWLESRMKWDCLRDRYRNVRVNMVLTDIGCKDVNGLE